MLYLAFLPLSIFSHTSVSHLNCFAWNFTEIVIVVGSKLILLKKYPFLQYREMTFVYVATIAFCKVLKLYCTGIFVLFLYMKILV